MPVVARLAGERAYLAVAALALACHVLDCVDGNIARATGRASRFGALLDGFVDLVFWALFFVAFGVLVDRAPASPLDGHGLELALGLAVLVLLHRNLRDNFALVFAGRADFTPAPPPRLTGWALWRVLLIGLERFYALGLVVAGFLGVLAPLLLAVAAYVVSIFVGALWITFAAARRARPDQ
jgi:phosphatidylglycerophosphate synthase